MGTSAEHNPRPAACCAAMTYAVVLCIESVGASPMILPDDSEALMGGDGVRYPRPTTTARPCGLPIYCAGESTWDNSPRRTKGRPWASSRTVVP